MKPAAPIPQRLLVVLPSWVGDVVMAMPALRAIRGLYPAAKITYLLKSYVRPLVDGLPWHDRLIVARPRADKKETGVNGKAKRRRPRLAARLNRRGFDAAVLFPNSFRAALLVTAAGIPRKIGYDRDGRGFMLTDRLLPMRRKGEYVPVSAVDYYLGLARYLGAESPDRKLKLFTRPGDDARAERLLRCAGVVPGERSLVMLNPGAATKGDAKLWPAGRFAAVADALIERHGVTVLVNGSPKERAILDDVHHAAHHTLIDLPRLGSDLTLLKSLVARCALAVTNDTGLRHIAAAMSTPVVSLFGPTDPTWALLDFDRETMIRSPDGSMTGIEVSAVIAAADAFLAGSAVVRSSVI